MAVDIGMPKNRSYSQLTSYSSCSYAYYLERVAKVPRAEAVWFAGGRAFHQATEWADREHAAGAFEFGAEADRQKLAAEWRTQFRAEVDVLREREPDETKWRKAGKASKDKPNGEDVEWWATAGEAMTLRYADWRRDAQWELWTLPDGKPAIEVPLQAGLGASGVPVVAYVDRIFVDPHLGSLSVVDLKTGSRKPPFPLQLGVYAGLLSACFGIPFHWGAYYMARDADVTDPYPLAGYTPELVGQMFSAMDESERRSLYLPNLGQHCYTCLVKQYCPAAGGKQWISPAA